MKAPPAAPEDGAETDARFAGSQDGGGLEGRRVRLGMQFATLFGVGDAGRVLRDFATYLPTQIIPAVAAFLVLPILARQLAPTELGTIAIAQTLVSLGWIVVGQWLTSSIIRELPAHQAAGDTASFTRGLRRGIGFSALLFAGYLAALGLGSTFSAAISVNFWLIAAAASGLTVQNFAVTLFAASLRPRAYGVVEVLARTGGIALGTVLVFRGHGIQGYLLGLGVCSWTVGLLGLWAAWPRARGRESDPVELRAWVRYGMPVSISSLATWGYLFVDRFLLAILESTGAVGVYSVGSVLGDRALMIPTLAFYTAARPLLVTAFERHGRTEVERLMRAYTRVMLLVLLPIIALLAAASKPLLLLVTGDETGNLYYLPAVTIVPIVAAGTLVYALGLIGTTGLVVGKRTIPMIYSALIGVGANIVANLILIPPYGIVGAAVATPIGAAAMLLATQVWSRRLVTWKFPIATLVRAVAAAGLGYAAARVSMPLASSHLVKLGIAAGAGGSVYALTLFLLGERRFALRRHSPA